MYGSIGWIQKQHLLFANNYIIFLIAMQSISDFVNSSISDYRVDSSHIQNFQGFVNLGMIPDGWFSIILSNRECIVFKLNTGVFFNQGFVVNDQKVLKVLGNHQIGGISYSEEQSTRVVEGIVDLDNGSRFEGSVLTEKEGKIGIPFGYGEMYDDNGLLIYKGIVINWNRFGYGTSYYDNGCVEYEGYWCDDIQFGIGKLYDRSGKFVNEYNRFYDYVVDIDRYEGDGIGLIHIGIKHMKLNNRCLLADWNVSCFSDLESIEIGDDCFERVRTFKIDGLNRLKTVKIGKDSFTQAKSTDRWNEEMAGIESKSFHIVNCESLESIQIGEYSFSDFGGRFELKNLPQLQSIQIGSTEYESYNFHCCSFVLQGIIVMLNSE